MHHAHALPHLGALLRTLVALRTGLGPASLLPLLPSWHDRGAAVLGGCVSLADAPDLSPGCQAVLDSSAGKAGSPTRSERRLLLIAELRQGGPRPGWQAKMGRKWGIKRAQVGQELAEARAELEASRTPEAAIVQAHELIVQSIETAQQIDRDAEEIEDPVDRARTRATAAGVKLKAAAELRQLYRKGGGLADALAAVAAGGALTSGALKG